MNQEERYLFDLNGYLVIEDVLTEEEVALANQAPLSKPLQRSRTTREAPGQVDDAEDGHATKLDLQQGPRP